MEIGLDYMQMRSQAQHLGLRWTGRALLLVGILIALGGIAFYGKLYWDRASLGKYVASFQQAAPLEDAAERQPESGQIVTPYALSEGAYAERAEDLGYTAMPNDTAWPIDTQPPARSLIVSGLSINAKVQDLTPINECTAAAAAAAPDAEGQDYGMVCANPGERGAMWFFGSYGKSVGSFGGLTDAAEKLESGDGVTIFVNNDEDISYLYGVTDAQIIPKDELRLNSSGRATVHLAMAVPPNWEDHYLVLSGELVGVK